MFEEEDVFYEFLPLLECRRLTISSYITQYSLSGLDNLLRSTPYPENLMIFPDYVPVYFHLISSIRDTSFSLLPLFQCL